MADFAVQFMERQRCALTYLPARNRHQAPHHVVISAPLRQVQADLNLFPVLLHRRRGTLAVGWLVFVWLVV